MNLKSVVISWVLLVVLTPGAGASTILKADSTWDDWQFRISPYLWLVGFKGTLARPTEPTQLPISPYYDIDVEFKDIRNNLKFIGMLNGHYRVKRFTAQFNLASVILESEAITPEDLILQDNRVKFNFFSGDFGGGYRLVQTSKFELDAMLALKFIYFKVGLSTNLLGVVGQSGERNDLWLEPVIGTNIMYKPHIRWEFIAYGDLGVGFIADDSYQYLVGVNHLFSKKFFTTVGYRLYYIDRSIAKLVYQGKVKGLLVRIGFQF